MKRLRSRPGLTMLEVLVSAGTASMILLGGYTMLQTASRSFDRNDRQTSADADAALAMTSIMGDMREAQSFRSPGQDQTAITYPPISSDPTPGTPTSGDETYDRYSSQAPNTPATIVYYLTLGKPDGTKSLVRRVDKNRNGIFDGPDEVGVILCRHVQSLTAATDTDLPNAMLITLRMKYTKDQNRAETSQEIAQGTAKVTELQQRVVFARNYDPGVNNP